MRRGAVRRLLGLRTPYSVYIFMYFVSSYPAGVAQHDPCVAHRSAAKSHVVDELGPVSSFDRDTTMADQHVTFHPRDALANTASTALQLTAVGAVLAGVQNTLRKQNVGAMGIFTRSGGIIALYGTWPHAKTGLV